MYTVYILRSLKTGKRYIGYTNNFIGRFWEHNRSTKGFDYRHKPFKVIYRKSIKTRIEAIRFERYLKNMKGGNKFKEILTSW